MPVLASAALRLVCPLPSRWELTDLLMVWDPMYTPYRRNSGVRRWPSRAVLRDGIFAVGCATSPAMSTRRRTAAARVEKWVVGSSCPVLGWPMGIQHRDFILKTHFYLWFWFSAHSFKKVYLHTVTYKLTFSKSYWFVKNMFLIFVSLPSWKLTTNLQQTVEICLTYSCHMHVPQLGSCIHTEKTRTSHRISGCWNGNTHFSNFSTAIDINAGVLVQIFL